MKNRNWEYPEIKSAIGVEYYPLSFQQERIWYLCQLSPESTVWNKLSCKCLKGGINVHVFKRAVEELTKWHSVLKTKIFIIQSTACQKPVDYELDYFQYVNRTDLPQCDWESEIQKLLKQEIAEAIDVQGEQLFWAKLIQLNEKNSIFYFKLHHIISDATTFQILWRDLKIIYTSYLAGEEVYPKSTLQYYDYAIWRKELNESPLLQIQESYWMDQFKDGLPLLNLPCDFPANSEAISQGAMEREWIPKEITQKLLSFSLHKRVILFSTLLTAYYVLLYKYCGQEDLAVGTVFSGRHYHNALKNLLGFYVNTVAIRTDISAESDFGELLQQIHKKVNEAYKMQDYPFEQLIRKINPNRNRKGNQLFRVAFNMVNEPKESNCFTGIEEERWVEPEVNSAQFDLTLDILNRNSENFEVRFEYNTGLFKKESIQRLLRNYIYLLGRIVDQADKKVKELDCLNPHERETVLYEWNKTRAEYLRDKCIHELFEKQAEATPDAVALIYEGKELTYFQLNQKADRLACLLKSQGIGANTFVGVLLNRSFEMVIAVMGILKAGGAYVPFEPNFPDARIKNIVNDLKIKLVVTQQEYSKRVWEIQGDLSDHPSPILLDTEMDGLSITNEETLPAGVHREGDSEYNLSAKVSPEDIAYVIYTSGSTGVPKGVAVKHKPVINLIEWVNQTFAIGTRDKLLFITSLCFDLSVYDIFGMLAAGGSIRIVSDCDIRNPEKLVEMINHENITFWDSAPAALQQLTPIISNERFKYLSRSLRLIFLSGDWIPITLPDLLKEKFPGVKVISLGGATEATVWSNYYPVQELESTWVSIPYGKPIQNAKYYVLDAYLSPCPIGVPGDLYIGGECLSIGYINDPTLTREKFLQNPFEEGENSLIYKTGDLARWYADGNLEFLGRKDHQVKIRGYRVELGEIDSHLIKCPEIKDVVVLAREDQQQEKYLCAYYVSEHSIGTDKLRETLAKELPEYMIPSYFVWLDKMPMTSNGKIDRNALPRPERIIRTDVEYIEPRNTLELRIAEIWKEILKVDRIGVNDNFFELGGHSLLATQLILRMREIFQLNIPLSKVLDFPSIGKLAGYIADCIDTMERKRQKEHFTTGEREIGKI